MGELSAALGLQGKYSPETGTFDRIQLVYRLYGPSSSRTVRYVWTLSLSMPGSVADLSHLKPYLLSLGMSKALLAFVWIAGPLTGTLVQPYIGICSDNCRVSWGKRKPFMIFGGMATVVALLALAWVQEIVGGFLGIFGVDPASSGTRTVVIILATILMYCLDFAINTGRT